MTRRIPEEPAVADEFVDVLHDFVEMKLKDVHTMLPGRILSYEGHSTRKAEVEVAVRMPTTNGEMIEIPPIQNVPVVFPSTSTASLLLPVKAGDGVLLCFSEVGIGKYLEGEATGSVNADSLARFSTTDCIAIPGLFNNAAVPELEVTPSEDDFTITQGTSTIVVKSDSIVIENGSTKIEVDPNGKVLVDASSVELNGNSKTFVTHTELSTAITTFMTLLNAHVHTSTAPTTPTSPPNVPMIFDISAATTTTVKTGG